MNEKIEKQIDKVRYHKIHLQCVRNTKRYNDCDTNRGFVSNERKKNDFEEKKNCKLRFSKCNRYILAKNVQKLV